MSKIKNSSSKIKVPSLNIKYINIVKPGCEAHGLVFEKNKVILLFISKLKLVQHFKYFWRIGLISKISIISRSNYPSFTVFIYSLALKNNINTINKYFIKNTYNTLYEFLNPF